MEMDADKAADIRNRHDFLRGKGLGEWTFC